MAVQSTLWLRRRSMQWGSRGGSAPRWGQPVQGDCGGGWGLSLSVESAACWPGSGSSMGRSMAWTAHPPRGWSWTRWRVSTGGSSGGGNGARSCCICSRRWSVDTVSPSRWCASVWLFGQAISAATVRYMPPAFIIFILKLDPNPNPNPIQSINHIKF